MTTSTQIPYNIYNQTQSSCLTNTSKFIAQSEQNAISNEITNGGWEFYFKSWNSILRHKIVLKVMEHSMEQFPGTVPQAGRNL